MIVISFRLIALPIMASKLPIQTVCVEAKNVSASFVSATFQLTRHSFKHLTNSFNLNARSSNRANYSFSQRKSNKLEVCKLGSSTKGLQFIT